jgi:hypothetical protein
MYVYVYEDSLGRNEKAVIVEDLGNDTFIVQYDDGNVKILTSSEIIKYYPCNCMGTEKDASNMNVLANGIDSVCFIPNYDVIKNI